MGSNASRSFTSIPYLSLSPLLPRLLLPIEKTEAQTGKVTQPSADFLFSEEVFVGLPVEATFSDHRETLTAFGNLWGSQNSNLGGSRLPSKRLRNMLLVTWIYSSLVSSHSLEAMLIYVKTASYRETSGEGILPLAAS